MVFVILYQSLWTNTMRFPDEVLPGWFRILGFPDYLISLDGRVIDHSTKQELVPFALGEYFYYTLFDFFGKKRLRGRHRLLMLTFKNASGLHTGVLEVNHINGVKGDDRLVNLEWVTPQRNCEHAGETGLSPKCIPISVRDVDTGEITKFPSIVECARELGMSKDSVSYRVNHGEHRVYPERNQYRKGHHDSDWSTDAVPFYGTSRKVYVRYVLTGDIMEFPCCLAAVTHLGISPATMVMWLSRPNQPVFLPGYVQVKQADDLSPWRQIDDPYLEILASRGSSRPIKVTNVDTGEVRVFHSGIECASQCGLKPSALYYRLKVGAAGVFSDRCRYEYYTSDNSCYGPTRQ